MVTREEIEKLNLKREDQDVLYVRIPTGSQFYQRKTGQYSFSVLEKVTKLVRDK